MPLNMDTWLKTGSFGKKKKVVQHDKVVDVASPSASTGGEQCPTSPKKRKISYRRSYNPDYLKIGFTYLGSEEKMKPQCVICFKTLASDSMKPNKLQRHFDTNHSEYLDKPLAFFEGRKKQLLSNRTAVESVAHGNEKFTMLSYQLSLLIAKKGAAHTTGEDIILPAAKMIVSTLFDEKAKKKIPEIPLSNNTVKRRIDDMSKNVEERLFSYLNESDYYSLQLDESTDIADNANLICFVRFELNGTFEEEFLFCKSLPTTTTGVEIFKCVDAFMKEHAIDWTKCVGLTTDGAAAMSGKHTGLVANVRKVAPLVQWTHCSIHREALAVKGMGAGLRRTLDDTVKIVNLIKSHPKNSRIFGILCDEMGSDHRQLLLHSEVRWLSRGKVLSRFVELRDEIRIFLTNLQEEGKGNATIFLNQNLNEQIWLIRACYLADIFSFLNILNLTLQGKDGHRFYVQDKVNGTIKKIERWLKKIENNNYEHLEVLSDFLIRNEVKVDEDTKKIIVDHLQSLATNLRHYFPMINTGKNWIRNPFEDVNLNDVDLTTAQEEQLLELSSDSRLKELYGHMTLASFWFEARKEYKGVGQEAIKFLMVFSNTYLCEKTFSTFVHLKNKYRNKLSAENDLRLKITKIDPDLNSLTSVMQSQGSH